MKYDEVQSLPESTFELLCNIMSIEEQFKQRTLEKSQSSMNKFNK